MEFGALQCKPKSPNCYKCPINKNCIAFSSNNVQNLPIKIKKNKVKNRFFNFFVHLSKNSETILEKRNEKGIWQHLYQFPLIETKSSVTKTNLLSNEQFKEKYKSKEQQIELINSEDIIHNLSHQKLHVKFWKINGYERSDKLIPYKDLTKYPVPTVIAEFIKIYNP